MIVTALVHELCLYCVRIPLSFHHLCSLICTLAIQSTMGFMAREILTEIPVFDYILPFDSERDPRVRRSDDQEALL